MRLASAAGLALALVSTTAVSASDISPADKKIMLGYTLTMPKLNAYEAPTAALKAAEAKDPSLAKDVEAAGSEHTTDMNGEFAKMDHHPRVYAFFAKSGLSKQDAILIPLTLMSACTVAQYPTMAPAMADQVSPGQIAFCKTNMPAISKMKFMKGG
jgi:hypothetical protein